MCVLGASFLRPVLGRIGIHVAHGDESLFDPATVYTELVPVFEPVLAIDFGIGVFKELIFPFFIQGPFQFGQHGDSPFIAKSFIEDPVEDGDDGIAVTLCRRWALGIDIKKNCQRRCFGSAFHILDQFRIRGDGVFGRQIGHGLLSVDFRFIEDIRKDFQEVRFTTAEEAGNPDAHFIDGMLQALHVIGKETLEMLFQFRRDDVFFQFLFFICFLILFRFNDPVNPSVDGFQE